MVAPVTGATTHTSVVGCGCLLQMGRRPALSGGESDNACNVHPPTGSNSQSSMRRHPHRIAVDDALRIRSRHGASNVTVRNNVDWDLLEALIGA